MLSVARGVERSVERRGTYNLLGKRIWNEQSSQFNATKNLRTQLS